jgi:hypothetical protein
MDYEADPGRSLKSNRLPAKSVLPTSVMEDSRKAAYRVFLPFLVLRLRQAFDEADKPNTLFAHKHQDSLVDNMLGRRAASSFDRPWRVVVSVFDCNVASPVLCCKAADLAVVAEWVADGGSGEFSWPLWLCSLAPLRGESRVPLLALYAGVHGDITEEHGNLK